MKDSSYHISLYVIVPVIFAGYAMLSSIIVYRLVQYRFKHDLPIENPVVWLIVGISAVGFLCGLAIVWVILRPLKEFIRNARSILPVEEQADGPDSGKRKEGQLEEWDRLFKRVTSVLSMVDARELFPEIITKSEIMRAVLSQITKVAPTDSTVLIIGESGTGKELVATSIYKQSNRRDKPFIKLNCVAVAKELWESELFGHEKGAFTGATNQKPGKFELANGGTLFLDEIGDMPLETQAKMLRVLQEREFERVGGTRTIKVDVRFIAATNKDLKKMVEEGKFREDLFFRLNVFYLSIPPLRKRREDIPVLAEYFCNKAHRKVGLSPVVLQMLRENSSWPGNVRELHNVIERASVMCEGEQIEPRHLPENIAGSDMYFPSSLEELGSSSVEEEEGNGDEGGNHDGGKVSLDNHLKKIERAMILEALRETDGVQVKAAKILGIKQRALWHRIKKHNIDAKSFKEESA